MRAFWIFVKFVLGISFWGAWPNQSAFLDHFRPKSAHFIHVVCVRIVKSPFRQFWSDYQSFWLSMRSRHWKIRWFSEKMLPFSSLHRVQVSIGRAWSWQWAKFRKYGLGKSLLSRKQWCVRLRCRSRSTLSCQNQCIFNPKTENSFKIIFWWIPRPDDRTAPIPKQHHPLKKDTFIEFLRLGGFAWDTCFLR